MKKVFLLFFSLCLLFFPILSCDTSSSSSDTTGTSSEDGGGYTTISDFDPLVGFTDDQLNEHYTKNYKNTETYKTAVIDPYDGSKTIGSLTEKALADFTRRTNFFRSFQQLPPVEVPTGENNAKCQEAALTMIAQSNISHTPLDDGFKYATAVAQEAASNSNLSIAWGEFAYTNLLDNLVMDQGVSSTGHRKWFLYPGQKGTGYGYNYNTKDPSYGEADTLVQWVFDTDDSFTYDYPVLYPPAGSYPIQFVYDAAFDSMVDFSLYWYKASFSGCSVTMTDGTGKSIPVTITYKENFNKYGMPPGGLIWQPSKTPTAGETWTITIKGISGASKSEITYKTKFVSIGASDKKSINKKVK